MKYIEKELEDLNTSAIVSYHEITAYAIDFKHQFASITVESYINKKAKEKGKQPVGSPISLSFSQADCPKTGCPIDWFLAQLIAPVPEGFEPQSYEGYINPHLLSGGEIKEE